MPEKLPSAVQSPAIPWQNAIRSDGMSAELKLRRAVHGGPNGNRTRVSGVRGQRPRPLDDGTLRAAMQAAMSNMQTARRCAVAACTSCDNWLGEEDSNPRKQVQSLSSYHWTIPQADTKSKQYIQKPCGCQG